MVYRDDRDALLARADALQKELDDNEREAAEQAGELSSAKKKLAAAEKELGQLRKRLAKLDQQSADGQPKPNPKAKTTALVMGGVLVSTAVAGGVMFATLGSGSKGDAEPAPEAVVAAAPADAAVPTRPCGSSAIDTTLEATLLSLHRCYQESVPDYRGRVAASWKLSDRGEGYDVELPDAVPPALVSCITNQIAGRSFDAKSCVAHRELVFEPTCPSESECAAASPAPVCCAAYALPERPTEAALNDTIAPIAPQIAACHAQHGGPSSVTLSVQITPRGTVGTVSSRALSTMSISISGTPTRSNNASGTVTVSIDLVTCIAAALATVRFPQSREGTVFEPTFSF